MDAEIVGWITIAVLAFCAVALTEYFAGRDYRFWQSWPRVSELVRVAHLAKKSREKRRRGCVGIPLSVSPFGKKWVVTSLGYESLIIVTEDDTVGFTSRGTSQNAPRAYCLFLKGDGNVVKVSAQRRTTMDWVSWEEKLTPEAEGMFRMLVDRIVEAKDED